MLSGGQFACWLVVCGVFVTACAYPLAHTDLWGHLAYGRWMAEQGRLPPFEPFLAQGRPIAFQPNAWLAQWAGFHGYETAGAAGLLTAHAALLAAAVALAGVALANRGLPPLWTALGMLAVYVVAEPQWAVIRPQLFGGLAFPLVLIAIDRLKRGPGPIVWLPLVFALWAQLHGTWLVGLVVLGTSTLGSAVDTLWLRRRDVRAWRDVSRGLACAALCLMAVCTNPAGPRGVWDAITLTQNPNLASMREWLPLTLADNGAWRFLFTLLLTGVALRVSPRRWTWAETLPLVVMAIAVFDTRRMLIWWALLWPWVVLPHLAARWPLDHALGRKRHRLVSFAAVASCLIALAASPLAQAAAGIRGVNDPTWLAPATPTAVAAQLEPLGVSGRVYAPMEWSDYLIWRSRGRVQPLVDSHVHLIEPGVWSDYRAIGRGNAQWKALLDRHGVRWLVLDRHAQPDLRALVTADPEFVAVYTDAEAAVYRWSPAS